MSHCLKILLLCQIYTNMVTFILGILAVHHTSMVVNNFTLIKEVIEKKDLRLVEDPITSNI